MARPTKNIVFAGPTLPRVPDGRWGQLLDDCDVRPPVRRGDVIAVMSEKPRTLVILDGYYYTVASVTHKEILYALDAGVRVIGAASMGALRAAELEAFGMEGVGCIFGWYRDGVIEGDDEVAVLHAAEEDGYRSLTVALVEVRRALEDLTGRGELPGQRAESLLNLLREMPFVERDLGTVLSKCGETLGRRTAEALECQLAERSLKAEDALAALELALEDQPSPESRPLRVTVFLNADRERHYRAGGGLELMRVWNAVQLLHPDAPALVEGLRTRWLLASTGIQPAEERLAELLEALTLQLEENGLADLLAEPELKEEAWMIAAAEKACYELGGVAEAGAVVARRWGWPSSATEKLTGLTAAIPEMVPSWWLGRSFLFCEAFPAARRAAESICEIYRCFVDWSQGARVSESDLIELSAELWQCGVTSVFSEAARRGLFRESGPEPGWRDAVEWIAAAERLPRPINDYPALRADLVAQPLRAIMEQDPRAPAPPSHAGQAP